MVRIYVGNLPFGATEDEIRALFSPHGKVESVRIITDRETGRSRGFGFVEMSDEVEAKKAMEALASCEIGGRTLVIDEARPREDRGPRRGPGGGGGQGRGGYGRRDR